MYIYIYVYVCSHTLIVITKHFWIKRNEFHLEPLALLSV